MRLATMSALVALTLKQREFHRFLSDRRGEDEEGKPPRDNRDEKSMIDNLERKCVLFDGYAHLTEEAVKDHPTIAQTRAEILHFLQISSHRWRRLDWLATHIVGLMKQCHTSSFVELRMVLWNFEVAVYNLQLLDAKKWDGCRQLWRTKVCNSMFISLACNTPGHCKIWWLLSGSKRLSWPFKLCAASKSASTLA